MARKPLIRSRENPYHVNCRANNREIFPCDLKTLWEIFLKYLAECEHRFDARIHAFVLMDNHFHLLISTPREDLGEVMQHLMRSVTKTINFKTGRSGRIFGSRYHWSIIHSVEYLDCALKYIYRNPVKSKATLYAQQYAYSTLHQIFFEKELPFAVVPAFGEKGIIPFDDMSGFLHWVNSPFQNEIDLEIKNALKRSRFLPFKRRKNYHVPAMAFIAAGTLPK